MKPISDGLPRARTLNGHPAVFGVLIAGLTAYAGAARAGVVITSATRSIGAHAEGLGNGVTQSDSFSGTGPYFQYVSAQAQACGQPTGVFSNGYASQYSTIGDESTTFSGTV